MTSTAVFHLGSAGAGGASTESHFSWSIQHPRSLNLKPSIARSQDDSWSPPLPRGSWVSSWHSGVPNGQINTDPYRAYNPLQGPFRARSGRQRQRPFESSSQSSFQEPLPDSLPVLVRESVLGTDDAGDYREVLQDVPPTPVEWLAPPQQEEDSWKGTPRRWKIPGQGVVSLLPWFLGMSVVGGAENPAGTRRQRPLADEPAAPRATTYRPPSRPAPGPIRTPKGSGDDMSTSNGRLKVLYQWKTIDYEFPNEATRTMAISNGAFIPENNLPLGVEAYRDRLFVSIPRWKPGVPATIAYLPKNPNGDVSARLKPYPDWSWHRVPRVGVNDSCQAFTSVFRMTVDECGRLWILDSGAVDAIGDIRSVCPPQIIVFDLNTDQLLWRYIIPKEQTKPESLFTSIVVDIRDNDCMNAYAYAADVFRYGLLVYSWREDRSYRLSHNFFFPDPIAARFNLDNITFRWMDGIFGLALSPVNMQTRDRALFFHPMASFREFAVRTSVIRNETYANNNPDEFKIIGLRGRTQAHSSASAMDRRGVLFFNLVTQDALGCWDSAKTYGKGSVGHVAQDKAVLNFPNDLKVDREEPQNIWLLTNRLHIYLYRNLSRDEYNYRILTGTVEKATEGTICDPSRSGPLTSVPKEIDACEDV